MSDTKHTPGPWHHGGSDKCTIYDKFGQRIANSFERVMVAHRSDAECEANARLIAAAPALLEALELAANRLARCALEGDARFAFGCTEWEREARAAIAAATAPEQAK